MATIVPSNTTPKGFETFAEAKARRAYKIEVLGGGNKSPTATGREIGTMPEG